MLENLDFGKTGFKTFFLKNIISHTHAFLLVNFNALRCFYTVSLFFSKTVFFFFLSKNFVSLCLLRLIQSAFRSIKIVLKFLKKPLSVSINRNSWIGFFKNQSLTFQTYFSKRFSNFFSLSELDKASSQFFVVFLQIFCKVFLFISQ